jgi:hypothetical protein
LATFLPKAKQRIARVKRVRRGVYVEFDLILGDKALLAELVLPCAAFHEFCAEQRLSVRLPKTMNEPARRVLQGHAESARAGAAIVAQPNRVLLP